MKQILGGVLLLALLVGRFFWYEHTHRSTVPQNWFDSKQTIQGVVVEDPDRGLTRTRLIVRHDIAGKLLVTIPTGVIVDYGDLVSITGTIEQPESFETTTGRMFDYPGYLAVENIYAIMRADVITVIDHGHGFKLWRYLFEIKKYFVITLKKFFDEAPAALLAGIVVGEQSLFPKQTLTDFQLAGLTHIIVLSGYNITLLVTFFVALFAWLGFGYRTRRIGAMIMIPLFIIMTGMGISLIRAGIMALGGMVLHITTRLNHNFRILIMTASVMIFQNPRILIHSPSFHLSFLAFIGLAYVVPLAHQKCESLPELFGLRDIAVETTAIQLFVLPYILWMSGQISAGSLLANILTVPIISLIMFGGFGAVLLGMIFPWWGGIVAWMVGWGLNYVLFIAHTVAGWSSISFIVRSFPAWVMLGAYGIMVVLIANIHHKLYVSKNLSKITNP